MAPARIVGRVFFPLDEQLGLDGAGVTPRGQEALVRLAAWMSFAHACELLNDLLGIQVSATSSRRYSYQAGQAALAVQQAEEDHIREDLPEPPLGAARQVISADGAFVPLVGGEWAEVKTLVVAEVGQTEQAEVTTTQVSSFSRLADVETFSQQAVVELHRRGTERAEAVCAVTDGAEWIQGLIDDQCPTALRILDFAHGAEYVSAMGQAATEAGSTLAPEWLAQVLHDLKHEGPTEVLSTLRSLSAQHPTVALLGEKLAYLEKREGHMQYPSYQQAGWPIGSGIVESVNKLVVEARLKGAGRHWERAHVNLLLVLRNTVCNQRGPETWQAVQAEQQAVRARHRQQQSQHRLLLAYGKLLLLQPQLNPLRRGRRFARYSWRRPFLRRPPACQHGSAKN